MPKRTTSACAENTLRKSVNSPQRRNYLRVRGEYAFMAFKDLPVLELPPRARRIQVKYGAGDTRLGTTSACAENTELMGAETFYTGNYLRVRGEYPGPKEYTPHRQELPPRARRILLAVFHLNLKNGTTSACAENTCTAPTTTVCAGNYLRVRGEYHGGVTAATKAAELPPRARRIRCCCEEF